MSLNKISIILSILLLIAACKSSNNNNLNHIPEIDKEKLQSGDIILKCGYGSISNYIVSTLNEKISISHCGFISTSKDSTYIIHSIAGELGAKDGVQTISLENFLKDCKKNSLYIIRHITDENARKKIELKAMEYLNNKTPFDYNFNIQNKDSLYCSEFVYQVLLDCYNTDYYLGNNVNKKGFLLFNPLINDTINFKHIYSAL